MDWLFDNPLADMRGPDFLVLYGVFAAAILLGAFLFIQTQDATASLPPPPAPRDNDPYEVAYLRGGVNDVIRTAIYALRRNRFIEIVEKGCIRALASNLGADQLSGIERRLLEAIRPAPTIAALFKDGALRSAVEGLCGGYKQRLSAQQLLAPPEVRRAGHFALAIGIGLLFALAGYKIVAATMHGKSNVGFLFAMVAGSCFILFWIVQKTTAGNASNRGKAFLSQLQLAYSGHVAKAFSSQPDGGVGSGSAYGAAPLFLVGLFGFSVLKGTPDEALAQQFAASQSSGGDGGGGCGGGDGGGGGCGGCGGGGGD